MINDAERELEIDVQRGAHRHLAVVAVQEGFCAEVKEPAEAALVVVLEDGAEAETRDDVVVREFLQRMLHFGESVGEGAAEAGVGLEVERHVVFSQGVVVQDHVGEELAGEVVVGVEASVREHGAGVVAVRAGDAQVPGVGEVVAEGKGRVPAEHVPGLAVLAVGLDVVREGKDGSALERKVPTVAVLIRGVAVRMRACRQHGHAQQHSCKQQGDFTHHGMEVFVF